MPDVPRSRSGEVKEILPNQILSRQAMRDLFGLSESGLSRAIRNDGLPCHWRLGRQWFIGAEVLAWIASGKPHRGCDCEDT